MSRARDELDLSYSGRPSMFLEALEAHVDRFDGGAASA
jgi:hypothetical protein